MSVCRLILLPILALPLLSACGIRPSDPTAISHTPMVRAASYGSSRYSVGSTHVSWVEPARHSGRLWPIYNLSLSLNHHLSFPAEPFNHWTFPTTWAPYLEWNQLSYPNPVISSSTSSFSSSRGYLFITLQGTVYLYSHISQSAWPIHPFADIPPEATIVAEYVPLAPAVKHGILPVYDGQPLVPGMALPPIWRSVTHLTVVPTKNPHK